MDLQAWNLRQIMQVKAGCNHSQGKITLQAAIPTLRRQFGGTKSEKGEAKTPANTKTQDFMRGTSRLLQISRHLLQLHCRSNLWRKVEGDSSNVEMWETTKYLWRERNRPRSEIKTVWNLSMLCDLWWRSAVKHGTWIDRQSKSSTERTTAC